MAGDSDGLLSKDWRDRRAPQPAAAARRPVFGKARELHLRARPASHQEELNRARQILSAGRAAVADSAAAVREGKSLQTTELVEIVDGVTASLVRDPLALPSISRLREQDEYTYTHSVAVCGWMIALAQELALPPDIVRDAGLAGLLHDIGKATLPPELLLRGTSRNAQEEALLREHPTRGHAVLSAAPDMPELVLEVARDHHERPDGAGYPTGKAGDALGRYARMAAVCNFYDRTTCPPPGQGKMPSSEAIDRLRADTGAFDAALVRAFARVVGTFLPGALVRLRSDRLGVVLDESERDPLHPTVAVFRYIGGTPITPQRLSTKSDPIIGIERPESWQFDDWPSRRRELLALSQ